jgi:hypothetical protein
VTSNNETLATNSVSVTALTRATRR